MFCARAFRIALLVGLVAFRAAAADLRVATLNCYLLFDPTVDHHSAAAQEERLTGAQYARKIANLASLVRGYQVVGLQETGGAREISDLAHAAGMDWAWVAGNDTATGEEVGLLFHVPGWRIAAAHREPLLEHLLSKHLSVDLRRGPERVHLLVIHLLRPVNAQGSRHRRQVEAVARWMKDTMAHDPGSVVVVLGDTNSGLTFAGSSLFGMGEEAGQRIEFAPTHVSGGMYDRLVVLGPGHWEKVEVRRPPYGLRPTATQKRLWTDHYLLGATLELR